jgi:hypothetical protein
VRHAGDGVCGFVRDAMHSSRQPLEHADVLATTPAVPAGGGLRLLKLDTFLARARSGLACLYESLSDLPRTEREAHFIQAPLYGDGGRSEITPIREILRRETVVISWRWPWQKPRGHDMSATGPAACEARKLLVPPSMLEQLAITCSSKDYRVIKYVWWDWATVPQYGQDPTATMIEIQNSAVCEPRVCKLHTHHVSSQ